jgi:hypothetical protein
MTTDGHTPPPAGYLSLTWVCALVPPRDGHRITPEAALARWRAYFDASSETYITEYLALLEDGAQLPCPAMLVSWDDCDLWMHPCVAWSILGVIWPAFSIAASRGFLADPHTREHYPDVWDVLEGRPAWREKEG